MQVIQTIITHRKTCYMYEFILLCIYCMCVRNIMRKRRAIVKEVEVDRGTAAKSLPIYVLHKNISRVIAQCEISLVVVHNTNMKIISNSNKFNKKIFIQYIE